MKFSDIQAKDWEQWKPYLDTCLLPLTGLTGDEQPWEATERLEQLRDLLDCLEKPFHGRIVTYPALHYLSESGGREALQELGLKLKSGGFKYVIAASVSPNYLNWLVEAVDLLIVRDLEELRERQGEVSREIHSLVQELWRS